MFYAHHYQIPCKAIVRGHYAELSPSLIYAQEQGMELHFVDAKQYDELKKDVNSLKSTYVSVIEHLEKAISNEKVPENLKEELKP